MALQSVTKIFIGGVEITAFKRLSLTQQIDSHHNLELTCRMDVLENLTAELASESKNFLGEMITVQIVATDSLSGYKQLEFKGVVTALKNIKAFGHYTGDEVIIRAQSPTFIADDGPHYASFNDVTLTEILEKTFKDYDKSKLEMLVQPNNDSSIHYSVQNRESAYQYASRLAAQYSEWFYYNGKQLVFGKPETEELPLTYNFDLKEYHLSLIPQTQNYKFYSNDYILDEIHETDAKTFTSGANGYNGFVENKAKEIFGKESQIWHNHFNDQTAKERMDKSIEAQKKSIEINQVKLSGVSDNPGVKLGNIVIVEGGKYRVTNIRHTTNEVGDYENRFDAVTAEFDAYPNTSITAFPRSESQTAVVMENIDEEGLGRIRVQFPWQKAMNEMTPWIRILTPHAGGEKGFHFTPEVGEEVLIGFEGANAERPYMMGALYHGNAKPEGFKTDANDIKAIRTRSGHTILFNDKENEESITISDMNGNTVFMDTQKKTVIVSSEEKIVLDSKYILMTADDIELSSKNTILKASESNTIQTGDKSSVGVVPDTVLLKTDNVNIDAKIEASINSAAIKTNSSGETNMTGTLIKLNS